MEKQQLARCLDYRWVAGDSSNQPSHRREQRPGPVAAMSSGSTINRPPKQRLSSLITSNIFTVKLGINHMELKLAQHGTKAYIQITKWVCESQDIMA